MKYKWEPLATNLISKSKKNRFYIRNTKPDGNCQFHAVAEAFKGEFNHRDLRKRIAEYILNELPDQEFKQIVNNYRIEKTHGEFVGQWDPFRVKTKTQFVRFLKKTGFCFQGDNITLSLMSRVLKTDFVVFNQHFINELSNVNDNVVLIFLENEHYRSVGIKTKGIRKVKTHFSRSDLPDILKSLIDREYFFENQIAQRIEDPNFHFTLPNLFKWIEKANTHKGSLTSDDTFLINSILKRALKTHQIPIKQVSSAKKLPVKLRPTKRSSLTKKSYKKRSLTKKTSKKRSLTKKSFSLTKKTSKKRSLTKKSSSLTKKKLTSIKRLPIRKRISRPR